MTSRSRFLRERHSVHKCGLAFDNKRANIYGRRRHQFAKVRVPSTEFRDMRIIKIVSGSNSRDKSKVAAVTSEAGDTGADAGWESLNVDR
jgi:hypothetical protein